MAMDCKTFEQESKPEKSSTARLTPFDLFRIGKVKILIGSMERVNQHKSC